MTQGEDGAMMRTPDKDEEEEEERRVALDLAEKAVVLLLDMVEGDATRLAMANASIVAEEEEEDGGKKKMKAQR